MSLIEIGYGFEAKNLRACASSGRPVAGLRLDKYRSAFATSPLCVTVMEF
jgi:hypothetical protein